MKRWTIRALAFTFSLSLLAAVGCSDDTPGQDDAAVDAAVQNDGGDAGPEALSLALGELQTVTADASGVAELTLATPEGTEEFLLMVHSRADALNTLRGYTAALPQAKSGRLPDTSSSDTMLRRWGCLSAGGTVDLADVIARLRDRRVVPGVPERRPPQPVPPPNVGEMVAFEIDTSTGIVTVQSEVLLVSGSLVIAIDRDTNPTLELDATTLDEIASGFEDIILPRERIFFGDESDVNEDGHVTVLFSPLVYDTGATAYVNPWDLITDPTVRPAGVAGNDQELIYITPPQLLEPHMATSRAILETVAHEFQHAIYFYRKYMLNDTVGDPEGAYITEGLSALAQDLTGYQAGNFFVSKAGLDEINDVSMNDLVGSTFYILPRDGALRGGAYLLLRYLYDQAGGDTVLPNGDIDLAGSPGIPWLRDFVDSAELGAASIEAATGQTIDQVAADWYIAMMVDDRTDDQSQPLNTDPRYNYLPTTPDPLTGRTRGTTMFESFMGMVDKTGPLVQELAAADGGIRVGGVEYLHLVATSTDVFSILIAADPEEVDIGLVIFRIR